MSAVLNFTFTKAVTANGTYFSEMKNLEMFSTRFVLAAVVSSYVNGDYTVTLQQSPDGGTSWADVDSLAVISANSTVTKALTNNIICNVRLKLLAANVVAGATVKASVHWDKEK